MIEVPLWSMIVFLVAFGIMMIHTIFGDLIGKVMYHCLKEKEKKDKGDDMNAS